jgi:hypothetical protein
MPQSSQRRRETPPRRELLPSPPQAALEIDRA